MNVGVNQKATFYKEFSIFSPLNKKIKVEPVNQIFHSVKKNFCVINIWIQKYVRYDLLIKNNTCVTASWSPYM